MWLDTDSGGPARGQVPGLDEPERYIAREHWRDDWAFRLVSAVDPVASLCVSISRSVGCWGWAAMACVAGY
eukprot:COSAG02_NODE_6232_length_3710_cov_3.154528_2_plen_71_part_00